MWCMYVWMLLYSVWLPSGAFLMVFPTSVAKKPLTTTYFFCQALEVNLAAIFRISLQFSAFYRDFPWSNGIFLVTMAESYLIGFQSFVSLRRMNWRACLGNLFVFTSIVRVVVHILDCMATCVICSQCHSRSFKGFFTQRNPVTTVSWVSICKSRLGSLWTL